MQQHYKSLLPLPPWLPLPLPQVAAFLLLVEAAVVVIGGPLIKRVFMGRAAEHQHKKAKRLVSQFAARFVGCVFLSLMVGGRAGGRVGGRAGGRPVAV